MEEQVSNSETTASNSSPFNLLPNELWLRILTELSVPTLCKCRLVSKKWRSLSQDISIWHHHCKALLPASFLAVTNPNLHSSKDNPSDHTSNTNSFNNCSSWESLYRRYARVQRNWTTATAVRVISFKAHDQRVTVLKLKGDLAITGSSDNTMRIWNVRTKECQLEIDVGADVNCVDFLVEQDVIACGSYYGEFGCKIYSLSLGKCLGQFMENHWIGTQCLAMNQDYVVLGSYSGDIYVIAWADGRKIAKFNEPRNPVAGVHLLGKDTILAIFTNGTIDTFSISGNVRLHQYIIPDSTSVCISAFDEHGNGRNVLCVAPNGNIVHLQWLSNDSLVGDERSQENPISSNSDELIRHAFSQDPVIHYRNTEISVRILCAAMDGKFNRGVIGSCLAWPPKGGVLVYDFEKGLGSMDGIHGPNAEEDALSNQHNNTVQQGDSSPVFTALGMNIEKVVAGCSRGWVYCFEFVGDLEEVGDSDASPSNESPS